MASKGKISEVTPPLSWQLVRCVFAKIGLLGFKKSIDFVTNSYYREWF